LAGNIVDKQDDAGPRPLKEIRLNVGLGFMLGISMSVEHRGGLVP